MNHRLLQSSRVRFQCVFSKLSKSKSIVCNTLNTKILHDTISCDSTALAFICKILTCVQYWTLLLCEEWMEADSLKIEFFAGLESESTGCWTELHVLLDGLISALIQVGLHTSPKANEPPLTVVRVRVYVYSGTFRVQAHP